MTLRSASIVFLCLACWLPVGPSLAADQEDLQEWRERILRSLEREESRNPQASPGRRESLTDRRPTEAGADAAAAQAQKQYGGRVLAVSRARDAYRVRLLLPDGRVTTVKVPD